MRFTVALLTFVAVACAAACLFAFVQGGLNVPAAWTSLAVGSVAGCFAFLQTKRTEQRPLSSWDWLACGAFGVMAFRAFFWLVWEADDSVFFLSPNNFGDLSLHITYIRLFTNGAAFWPDNPIYFGTPLHYPLGVDVFNSLLVLAGMDIYRSLVWVGLVAAVATGVALFAWGRSFVIAAFLFNGGLAALPFLSDFQFADYQENLAWKSIPLAIFITQRGMLWAIPAALVLLSSWRSRFFSDNTLGRGWRLPFWVEVALYGTMPFFHFHTFLFLSLLLGAWLLTAPWPVRKSAGLLVAAAIVPGTIFTSFVTGLFRHETAPPPSSFLSTVETPPVTHLEKLELAMNNWFAEHHLPLWIKLGWLQRGEDFFSFWSGNFGILPILVVGLIILLLYRKEERASCARWFVFPSLFIFVLTFVVMFARWEWDNTKLMIWGYLGIMPFLYELLVARWPAAIRAGACALLFFSGAVSLVGGLDGSHTGYVLTSRNELAETADLVSGIPINEPIAGYPRYNHTLLLNGRKMPMGFDGHLWSHGIDCRRRKELVDTLMNGSNGWKESAAALGVRYLFWGAMEEQNYPQSARPWRTSAKLVKLNDFGEVYDLATPWKPVTGTE